MAIYLGHQDYKPRPGATREHWLTVLELFDNCGPGIDRNRLEQHTDPKFIDYMLDRGYLIHGYEIGQP